MKGKAKRGAPRLQEEQVKVLGMQFSPPSFNDGGEDWKRSPRLDFVVKLGGRSDHVWAFLVQASGDQVYLKLHCGPESGGEEWEGSVQLLGGKLVPPKGDETSPETVMVFRIEARENTSTMLEFMAWRCVLADSEGNAASMQAQLWQEDLPMEGE